MVTKYWWPGWWGRFGATLKRPILYRDQHFPIENPQEMVEFSLFSSHGQTNLFFFKFSPVKQILVLNLALMTQNTWLWSAIDSS